MAASHLGVHYYKEIRQVARFLGLYKSIPAHELSEPGLFFAPEFLKSTLDPGCQLESSRSTRVRQRQKVSVRPLLFMRLEL